MKNYVLGCILWINRFWEKNWNWSRRNNASGSVFRFFFVGSRSNWSRFLILVGGLSCPACWSVVNCVWSFSDTILWLNLLYCQLIYVWMRLCKSKTKLCVKHSVNLYAYYILINAGQNSKRSVVRFHLFVLNYIRSHEPCYLGHGYCISHCPFISL